MRRPVEERKEMPLSILETAVVNAVKNAGEVGITVDELVDIVYSGVEGGGPLDARGSIVTTICYIKQKTDFNIARRYVYRIE